MSAAQLKIGYLVLLLLVGISISRFAFTKALNARLEMFAPQETRYLQTAASQLDDSTKLTTLMRGGALMLNSGYPEHALPLFLKAEQIEPVPPDSFAGAALALERLGNLPLAMGQIKKGLAYNPIWQPLLEQCARIAALAAKEQQRQICYDRMELLRQVPTWK